MDDQVFRERAVLPDWQIISGAGPAQRLRARVSDDPDDRPLGGFCPGTAAGVQEDQRRSDWRATG